jgi:hypothetical protein
MNRVSIVVLTILLLLSAFLSGCARAPQADKTVVEILYLPHPPVKAVMTQVDSVLVRHPGLDVRKVSFDDPDSQALIDKYKLTGHTPIAIFINGRNQFNVAGRQVIFRNFPKNNSFLPPGMGGNWDYKDLEAVLARQKPGAGK